MHAASAETDAIRVLRKTLVQVLGDAGAPLAYRLRLSLAVMQDTGWDAAPVLQAATRGAAILAQCSIGVDAIELTEFSGPARYGSLFTPVSRRLASELNLPKPALFFVADTQHRPAFDAEAVGRGNSRTRPEMADTVWVVKGAKDVELVIAHELAHVLGDSGDHTEEAGNLMREETSPGDTRLSAVQCEAIVRTATSNGLLQPAR